MEQEVAYHQVDGQSVTGKIESLFEKTQTYSKTTIEVAKLKGLLATTSVVTLLISRISIILLFMVFTLVLSLGIALWIGEALGKSYYGFFIVAGFYLLLGFIMILFLKKWIEKPVSDLIISNALQ